MKKMMYIRLKIAVCAILLSATMFSCTKEEMVAEPLRKGPEIGFGVNLGWEADKIGTKSEADDYGIYKGDVVLQSSESDKVLTAGIYIKEGIETSNLPATKGSVLTINNLMDFGAYCKLINNDGGESSYFSNVAVTKNSGNIWSPSANYYWPGTDYTSLEFLAVAPLTNGMTPNQDSNLPTSFTYSVPSTAADQKDILIATPKYATDKSSYPGNYNQSVDLQFNHILSAVNVKIGDIPEGVIKSIKFIGVFAKNCTYNVADATWTTSTSIDDLADFSIDLGDGYNVTSETQSGTVLNPDVATFMMIPQKLGENAKLEVLFHHNSTNRDVTLTSLLMGGEWPQGHTVNYVISITPESDLTFETEQENMPIRDCHYDIQELVIKTTNSAATWSMESDSEWATLRSKPAKNDSDLDLYYKGFWVESHKGGKTLANQSISKGSTANVLVYLYENTTNQDRVATISLYAHINGEKVLVGTRKILQYAPMWVNGKAYERIEEIIDPTNNPNNTFIWGYNWPETITYKGDVGLLGSLIFKVLQIFGYAQNVSMNWGGTTATINTAGLSTLGTNGSSTTDGLTNTTQLWEFKGGADLVNTMSLLEAWGMTYESGNDGVANLSSFAIRMVAYKNKHKEKTESSSGQTIRVAELTDDGIQWYLPASGEIGDLINTACDDDGTTNDTQLSGNYWSSTAVSTGDTKNTHSYYYGATDNATTKTANRNTLYKIRAARQQPTTTN